MMMLQEMVNLIFIGHLKDTYMLAAVGLGNNYVNMFGVSLIIGMNGALNTLVS